MATTSEGKQLLDYAKPEPLIPPSTVVWVRRIYGSIIAVVFIVAVVVALSFARLASRCFSARMNLKLTHYRV